MSIFYILPFLAGGGRPPSPDRGHVPYKVELVFGAHPI